MYLSCEARKCCWAGSGRFNCTFTRLLILLALVPCSGVVAGQEIATSGCPAASVCPPSSDVRGSVFIDANFNHLKDGTVRTAPVR
jgi:hypothetical protein